MPTPRDTDTDTRTDTRTDTDTHPGARRGGATVTRGVPGFVITGRAGVGLTSPVPWRVDVSPGDTLERVEIPAAETGLVGRAVAQDDELRCVVLPQGLPDGVADVTELADLEDLWRGTAVGVDLLLDDGTRLSQTGAVDQYGGSIDPDAQAAARRTWVDQWNLRRVALRGVAGRTVAAVELVVRAAPARALTVCLDALAIRPAGPLADRPLDRVRTTRGSHSSHAFSRGNNAPLVGVPHGCLYATPVTDADSRRWLYSWHGHGRDGDPRPALAAIATTHIPSPWMGDRGQLQVMPTLRRTTDRAERALPFDHDDETDRPHLWAADLEGGIRVETTAGPSVMAVRCTFPPDAVDPGVVLDHLGSMTDVAIAVDDGTLVLTGLLTDDPAELRAGAPAHHVHLRVPAAREHDLAPVDGVLRGRVGVDPTAPVTVLVGLSTLDAATAAAHVARVGSFDDLLAQAARSWDEVLGTVTVEGATDDQQVALASNLYRLFLFPTRQDEPTDDGTTRWRSVYTGTEPSLRAAEIGDRPDTGTGWYSATNGFWDTYRTAWPLLGLLTPQTAGDAAQGFVAHHLDSGWMPRWSAPAPADCMTGTTSDTVLADLVGYGVPGIDLREAYDSALTDASVPPTDERVGRKGLHPGLFRGYVSTAVHEGLAWTLDAALNDWSASRLARALMATLPEGPERARVGAEAEWLERRSLLYAEMFDPERGLFVGRDDDGGWRVSAADFDPDDWGTDYTETNAWGTAVTVPHDGAGLVRLHGGEEGLSRMLDAIVARPETGAAAHKGSYSHAIHEMTEARDCRMGMIALSNQPAHHIPFMLMHVGRHDDAHALVADALDRLFVGSDLGQGYPGDEDNGEMSAWWVFATIALYPLVPASGTFVLLPPRVRRTLLRPAGGAPVEIVVTNWDDVTDGDGGGPDDGGRFIRSVTIDGEPWHDISVPHAVLARGARIEVELAPEPCGWARDTRPVSASALHGFTEPLRDVTRAARSTHPALVDDVGATAVALPAREPVTIELDAPAAVGDLVTVTTDEPQTLGWRLEAMTDDGWHLLDDRAAEPFARVGQTRVLRTRGALDGVTRLRFTPDTDCRLRQLEVFAP